MLAASIPTRIPVPFANSAVAPYIRAVSSTSLIGIQGGSASFPDGFPPLCFQSVGAGGVPPWGADFNGILNQTTAWLRWIQAGGGIVAYNAAFSTAIGGYPQGALLGQAAAPGKFWLSTVDNNTSNPDTGGANWTSVPAAPSAPTYQRLTGSGTYTATSANVVYVEIEMVAAGAGGGAAFTNDGAAPSADASFKDWTAKKGNPGTHGTIGTSAAANGGLGGTGGSNGTGTLIDRIDGGDGQSGGNITGVNGILPGGNGGSNPRGGAGRGSQNAAGENGAATSGAGGGGGSGFVNPNGAGGGGGGAGEYVKFQMTRAQASGSAYVLPSGGAGGTAGTNPGGNGGSAFCLVKEFYQ